MDKFLQLLFLSFLVKPGIPKSHRGCISDPADVVFLLDRSGSIGLESFRKELEFVAHFARHYVVGPHSVQIGVVTFSGSATKEFDLKTFSNIHKLEHSIMGIKYHYNGTHTSTGLKFVRENSFTAAAGKRPGVPSFLIVITDGISRPQQFNPTTEAQILHSQTNIEVFAIGVGNQISMDELKVIASDNNHVKTVENNHELHLPLREIRCDEFKDLVTTIPTTKISTTKVTSVPTTKISTTKVFSTTLTTQPSTTKVTTPATKPTTTKVTTSTTKPTTTKVTTPTTKPTTTKVTTPTTQPTTTEVTTPTTQPTTTKVATPTTKPTTTKVTAPTTKPTTTKVTTPTTQPATTKVKTVCNPSPCHNGATCLDMVTMPICICAKGFTGTFCRQRHVQCMGCKGIPEPHDCKEIITCAEHETCSTDFYITPQGHVFYDLGCSTNRVCAAISQYGKREFEVKRQDANVHICQECCNTENCNRFGCSDKADLNRTVCYSCKDVKHPSDCDQIDICNIDKRCYARHFINDMFEERWSLGCERQTVCITSYCKKSANANNCFGLNSSTYDEVCVAWRDLGDNCIKCSDIAKNSMFIGHPRNRRQIGGFDALDLCYYCCEDNFCNKYDCVKGLLADKKTTPSPRTESSSTNVNPSITSTNNASDSTLSTPSSTTVTTPLPITKNSTLIASTTNSINTAGSTVTPQRENSSFNFPTPIRSSTLSTEKTASITTNTYLPHATQQPTSVLADKKTTSSPRTDSSSTIVNPSTTSKYNASYPTSPISSSTTIATPLPIKKNSTLNSTVSAKPTAGSTASQQRNNSSFNFVTSVRSSTSSTENTDSVTKDTYPPQTTLPSITTGPFSCYRCEYTNHETECNNKAICSLGQDHCYLARVDGGEENDNYCFYKMGCMSINNCDTYISRIKGNKSITMMASEDKLEHFECCNTPNCNEHVIIDHPTRCKHLPMAYP